jgi:predicted permease
MDSLIFALNALLPIILTVAAGYYIKRIGFVNETFAKAGNKLVFRIFLPAMLFLNVYKMDISNSFDFTYIFYVQIFTVAMFFIALPLVILITKKKERRGPLLQAIFRSNFALIGLPLAQALFGDEGVTVAALLSALTIPVFNMLAVVSLTIFMSDAKKFNFKEVFAGVIKNPLIQSVFAGFVALFIRFLFIKANIGFRLSDTPVYTVLNYFSNMATPLALLMLGAQFEFSAVKELKKEIIFGTAMRIIIVPLIALSIALLFGEKFNGAHFAAFVAVFATPVAVSSVPMTQEMNNDATLAGQLVVWTTLLSAITVFLFTYALKVLSVF